MANVANDVNASDHKCPSLTDVHENQDAEKQVSEALSILDLNKYRRSTRNKRLAVKEKENQVMKKLKTNDQEEKVVEVNKKIQETKEIKIQPKEKGVEVSIQKTISSSTTTEKILTREFYKRNVVTVSRELLGKIIIRRYDDKVIKCRIVETEAYAGIEDKGCHSYNGKKTEKNKTMYLDGGHAYVYCIHGSFCLNLTASNEGDPSAALIRAVEVIEGYDTVVANRNTKKNSITGKELTNGPGKLCAAMKIDKTLNGHDITQFGELYLIEENTPPFEVVVTKRINIDYAQEYIHKPWRFCVKNNIYVSVKGVPVDPEPST